MPKALQTMRVYKEFNVDLTVLLFTPTLENDLNLLLAQNHKTLAGRLLWILKQHGQSAVTQMNDMIHKAAMRAKSQK